MLPPHLKEKTFPPWQRLPNKVAFVMGAEESVVAAALPSAFTRAGLLNRTAFSNIPPPAAMCFFAVQTDEQDWVVNSNMLKLCSY